MQTRFDRQTPYLIVKGFAAGKLERLWIRIWPGQIGNLRKSFARFALFIQETWSDTEIFDETLLNNLNFGAAN